MPVTNFQQSVDFSGQNFYVGIDIHKKSWAVTVRTMNIEVARFTQPPDPQNLSSHLKNKFPNGIFHSAYEAGFCGTSYHDNLLRLGIENIIVHPADIPSTDKQKKNKTDLHDSRSISYYLEKGLLHSIHVLPKGNQEIRSLFRLRQSKVKDVTRISNKLKSYIQFMGIAIPNDSKNSKLTNRSIQWLGNQKFDTVAGSITLRQYINDLIYHRKQLLEVTKILRKQISSIYPQQYTCLLSVPGIGPIVAMALLAEIGDFARFKDPDQYTSYLGLTPWENSSGDSITTRGMQPRGNKYLRPLLIETSWAAVKHAPELLLYYRKHAVKNSKHAIVKVARKVALIARSVVTHLQLYNPEYKTINNYSEVNS
jgi:transposase